MVDWNELFYYDETSPSCLRWKVDRYSGRYYSILEASAGDIAGGVTSEDYWKVRCCGSKNFAHRIVYTLKFGVIPDNMQIDHIDGNRLNNKISNLRAISKLVNSRNKKSESRNTSGFVGVYRTRSYWTASWYCATTLKQKTRNFCTLKYGEDLAFDKAIAYRVAMIFKQNMLGQGTQNDTY